ncbi:MAG: enoyl-CoA hydratase/isomerase family protein [Alphaproteobacteria bacterium]
MSNEILVQQDGPILRVTLNRPNEGNGVSDAMAGELTGILDGAADTSQFVLLRGAGADFCTGRWYSANRPVGPSPEALALRRRNEVIFNCYGAFRRSPIPIVGVAQGRSAGFGCALAALCDITIASDSATFQFPEMGHNIMPTMAMSALVDRVPRKALMYLIYSTAVIGAERALSFGLVSEVVPAAKLDEAVETLCAALLKSPAPATLAVKEYAQAALSMDVQGAIDFARNLHATINTSSEVRR